MLCLFQCSLTIYLNKSNAVHWTRKNVVFFPVFLSFTEGSQIRFKKKSQIENFSNFSLLSFECMRNGHCHYAYWFHRWCGKKICPFEIRIYVCVCTHLSFCKKKAMKRKLKSVASAKAHEICWQIGGVSWHYISH